LCFAEVLFYLNIDLNCEKRALALVSMYSPPDPALLKASYNTLWSCTYQGDAAIRVVNATAIIRVVAMVPHCLFSVDLVDRFFMVKKPGLNVAHMGGNDEEIIDM
jgi:hypothetical protein